MSADGPAGPAEGTPEDRLRALAAGDGPPEGLPPPDDADDPEETGDDDASLPAAVLERTLADLAAVPPASMPPHVLARIDRALAAERGAGGEDGTGGTGDAGETTADAPARPGRRGPRPGPHRRRGRVLLVVAALLVLTGAGLAGVLAGTATGPAAPTAAPAPSGTRLTGTPLTGTPPSASGPPGLAAADTPAALRAGLGRADYGTLADPVRLAGCLDAHAVPATVRPAGARRVVLGGRPGVLLVLPTGVAARFRVLVVGEDCGADTPATLADAVVGP